MKTLTDHSLVLSRGQVKRINQVLAAPTERFTDLALAAGLRPDRDFRFKNFQGIILEEEDLTANGPLKADVDFRHSDLRGARLRRVILPAGTLQRCDLRGAVFEDVREAEHLVPPEDLPDFAIFKEAPYAPEMVVIPGGTFTMGSPRDEKSRDEDEGPQHEVTVPRFAMGRHPVTFEEYDAFCAKSGGPRKPDDEGWDRGRRPVINVSAQDAEAYTRWLADRTGGLYRLPSEAEWEYACRAGTKTRHWFGDDDRQLKDHAWFGKNAGGKTQPVGAEGHANPWGLSDMHGNVLEWVQDCWHGNYNEAPTDGSAWMATNGGDCSRSVLRGGSWNGNPWFLRSANRIRSLRTSRYFSIGFRLARTLP